MAIVISGVNNNDKITATDGVIDSISGFNLAGIITASSFTGDLTGDVTGNISGNNGVFGDFVSVGSNIQLGQAGILTATTFSGNLTGNVNATSNLLLQIGGSEKFRVGSSGQLGIGGANYGTSGQVLTSGGSSGAATWQTIDLNNLNATNLTSGTIPDARFPSTLPAASGANLTNLPAANLTGTLPAISGANLTALPAPNRNLIENGEFLVSQRFGNASSTKANSGTNIVNGVENGVVDRWRMSSPSASNFARQRVTDAPDGFAYSFKVTNDSSVYSPASNANYSSFQQIIEATNVARLAFGTSSAKTVTLSFYVKSTYASSTWAVALGNCTGGHYSSGNNTRTHIKSYSISSANTWERKTITFPGDTSGTWTKEGADGGLSVIWDLGSGGNHQGAATSTWVSSDDYRFSGAKNVGDSANGSWQITGIQLEIGSTATEYEHIPIQKEIERCQRYFYCSGLLGSGSWNSAQLFHCAVHHPVAMRARITSASTRSGVLSNINIEPRDQYDVTAFQPAGHTHYSPGQVHSNQVMNFQISGSASTADAGTISMDRNDDQFWLSAEL